MKPRPTTRTAERPDRLGRVPRAASTARRRGARRKSLRLSPEQAKAVLDERARALARVPPAAPKASEVLEIATFALANEHYGVETRYVREVVRLADYTPLPGAPAFLVGVLNLRGEILALIDLRTFFGVPARGLTDLAASSSWATTAPSSACWPTRPRKSPLYGSMKSTSRRSRRPASAGSTCGA